MKNELASSRSLRLRAPSVSNLCLIRGLPDLLPIAVVEVPGAFAQANGDGPSRGLETRRCRPSFDQMTSENWRVQEV